MTYMNLTKDELITVINMLFNLYGNNITTLYKIIDLITGNLTVISDGEGKWYFFEDGNLL